MQAAPGLVVNLRQVSDPLPVVDAGNPAVGRGSDAKEEPAEALENPFASYL